MKVTPSFIDSQAILGVYDFLLSDEHNLSYINKYPDTSELYNGSEQDQQVWAEESESIHIHPSWMYSTRLRGVNKGLLKQSDAFENIHI